MLCVQVNNGLPLITLSAVPDQRYNAYYINQIAATHLHYLISDPAFD